MTVFGPGLTALRLQQPPVRFIAHHMEQQSLGHLDPAPGISRKPGLRMKLARRSGHVVA